MVTSFAIHLAKKGQPLFRIAPSAVLVLVWNCLMNSYYIIASRFTGGFIDQVAPATWYNFSANIIQYNIDQLVGASADELNFVIYWHILSEPLVLFLFYLLQCLFYSTSGVSVSLVLVSHSFLKHKLENISLIKNPIKLIVRVLCYARKHKYPENRSALTYWEEEAPSRLDLGKDKYGGPFTEEEVEDVKTVFRMLPLFIAFSYIPSMLTRMSVGIFLAFIVTVSKVIIFVIERSHPDINNFGKLLFIPQAIQAISYVLVYPVSLEFTVAQSPVHMRGVMVGLWFVTSAIGYVVSITFKLPFNCENPYICASSYYYITKSVLVLIILIVFVILAKRYKYRVRENEVNIVQIVDDHYQRYINQREQFGSDTDSDSSIGIIMVTSLAKQLARKWQPYLYITPSAVLVLVWNYLMYSYYILGSRFTGEFLSEVAPATWYNFSANIIQYNIDQLVGASADELNSVIYWHILSETLVLFLFYLLQCLFYSTSGVSVSLVLVSHSFLKHKLENISLIKNPIKLIVRVLCYARKHKYPENRSALTYWEEEAPSRLELGKDKYGGPFTEEEVEDVKTVFRMLPLLIGFVTVNLSIDTYWSADKSFKLQTCLAVTGSLYYLCSAILIVCFYKYIPSMLTRMSIGIFLAFFATVSKVIIFVIEGSHSEIYHYISLEFTVAQSPVHMRGVMVGLWFVTSGISYIVNITFKFPFDCESQYICTSFYYYKTKSVLVLIILIVFVILAKRYKYRVRENEVNIVQIVDDHYQRYMEQEEQYIRDRDDDIEYSVD
uniref:Uncharacterized protein n=1 Tax=Amphimedon queenslandica TaxID=400682 RepID=A0A1X7TBM3_AMPQE